VPDTRHRVASGRFYLTRGAHILAERACTRRIRIGIITRKRFTPQPADGVPREHLANRQTMRPKVKRAPLKSSPARTNPLSVVITKSKRFTRLDTRTDLTRRTFPFPDPGLAVGSDSHEVPFYRVNALSSDGFIGEGSNGTRGRESGVFASASRFFSQGLGFPRWSGQGVGGEGSSSVPARAFETPEDQFRDTDTTTRNMETPL